MKLIICLLGIVCAQFVTAQQVPELTLRTHQGESFFLADSLSNDKNYLLTTTADWCTWCKKSFREWSTCYDELSQKYNFEIIALSSDGYADEDQERAVEQFEENGFPYKLWFSDHTSLSRAFGDLAYPTKYFVQNGLDWLATDKGYVSCLSLDEQLEQHFGVQLSALTEDTASTIKIYPNPVTSRLNIISRGSTDYQVIIYDQLGVILHEQSGSSSIDLGHLSSGIYYLKLILHNESTVHTTVLTKI